ncbi:MAG: nucleoside triphosphate pyrophosphohydrolase [Muribaculaceae bacterium]|nr:nucleoside triphosphate pyrophosphohydrolase [Muribaculaceae bacterium]
MKNKEEKLAALGEVLEVLDTLRVQCPWDRKQTNESLRPNTIEEVYELCDALIADDSANIKKELGDVLLHVAFYAKIAEEKGDFDIADVCNALTAKLKFRHPHIYGDIKADTAEQVSQNWEKIKQREKGGNKSVLSGVPSALPALIKAARIQEKARNVGFDWQKREDVWDKVREEVAEVEAEMKEMTNGEQSSQKLEEEFGDLLFSVINAARLYGVDPENALEHTNRKFIKRFNHIESRLKEEGLGFQDAGLEKMDILWNEAKNL